MSFLFSKEDAEQLMNKPPLSKTILIEYNTWKKLILSRALQIRKAHAFMQTARAFRAFERNLLTAAATMRAAEAVISSTLQRAGY